MFPAQAFVSMSDELEKLALPRYEQEIAKGTIPREAVTPGVPNMPGFLNMGSRKETRERLAAPAARSPEAVSKTRALNEKLYNAQMKNPMAAVGGNPKDIKDRVLASKEVYPGLIAGTQPRLNGAEGSIVRTPEISGAFMRRAGEGPLGQARAQIAAGMSGHPGVTEEQLRGVLGPAADVDRTINKAVGQHELGEALGVRGGVIHPHASHVGPEPILREAIAAHGDPEALGVLARVRQSNPDDQLMQKMIRQVGGTADAPLPVGGRQHRTLERMLDKNVTKLSPGGRQMGQNLRGDHLKVPMIPAHVPTNESLMMSGGELAENIKNKSLRGTVDAARGAFGKLRTLQKYVGKGI